MKVLVLGSGAREHALVRALAADPSVDRIVAAPGNPGIAELAETVDLDPADAVSVVQLAEDVAADLVVVGPEAPLVAGIADYLHAAGRRVFGPTAAAAKLEGSKAFAKRVMDAAGVPTAASRAVESEADIAAALDAFGAPYVVKDDGLAAGKGVVVTSDRDEAIAHARACVAGPHGRVVIEEYLDGPEVSLFCLCDGRTVVPLVPAQDFKRVGDGDTGPNTGGMGAYSPLPWAPAGLVDEVLATVAEPTVAQLAGAGLPFVGVLYCGLALTSRGLRVIEFNVRFGDPETQVVLARLKTPLGGVLAAAADGRLDEIGPLEWRDDAAVTVVVASAGYPEAPRRGDAITGLGEDDGDSYVLHAGTALEEDRLVSAGGRVLSVVATGADLDAARTAAYRRVAGIRLAGSHHRHDIAELAARGAVAVPVDDQR